MQRVIREVKYALILPELKPGGFSRLGARPNFHIQKADGLTTSFFSAPNLPSFFPVRLKLHPRSLIVALPPPPFLLNLDPPAAQRLSQNVPSE